MSTRCAPGGAGRGRTQVECHPQASRRACALCGPPDPAAPPFLTPRALPHFRSPAARCRAPWTSSCAPTTATAPRPATASASRAAWWCAPTSARSTPPARASASARVRGAVGGAGRVLGGQAQGNRPAGGCAAPVRACLEVGAAAGYLENPSFLTRPPPSCRRAASGAADAAGEGVIGGMGAGVREVSYRLMFIACSAQVRFGGIAGGWGAERVHRRWTVG
jgi:hypothetical protein